MQSHAEIALLAPVPLTHLRSALDSASRLRPHPVAFGSRDWQVFEELEAELLAAGLPAHVFIYASQAGELHGTVAWHGVYAGHNRSSNGVYTGPKMNRPPTTRDDDQDYWAVYWEVTGLAEIQPLQVNEFRTWNHDKALERSFVPHGPVLVANPWED